MPASITMESASQNSLPELVLQPALVVVEQPGGAVPVFELQRDIKQLKESMAALRRDQKQLQKMVAAMQRRVNAIALTALFDAARTKINNGIELTGPEKTCWNQRVENMAQADLQALGLNMQQLMLTKYKPDTVQHLDRDVWRSVEEVAEAVTAQGDDHRRLFEFVYEDEPGKFLFVEE